MTLERTYPSPSPLRHPVRTKAPRLLALAAAVYVLTYALAYAQRKPAGNLAYFCYTGPAFSEHVEHALYRIYWPVYKLHRALGAWRHNGDRDPPFEAPLG